MLVYENGDPFSVGRSRFADQTEQAQEATAKIFVKIQPQTLEGPVFAQLDTGAPWSIFEASVAEALDLLDAEGEVTPLLTRRGRITGRLVRTQLDIVADEGQSLSVQATVWVSPDWTYGNFLGYGGLLEHMRFAFDPSGDFFYFGPL